MFQKSFLSVRNGLFKRRCSLRATVGLEQRLIRLHHKEKETKLSVESSVQKIPNLKSSKPCKARYLQNWELYERSSTNGTFKNGRYLQAKKNFLILTKSSNAAFERINVLKINVQGLLLKNTMMGNIRLFSTVNTDDCKEPEQSSNISSSERIYLVPKNVLHNAYDIVAQQLKNRDMKLQPTYHIVKGKGKNSSWSCTYSTKWPEPMKFVSTGQTKQEASHKAALATLMWLRKAEKITNEGFPILICNSEIKNVVKQSLPKLCLDEQTINQMDGITKLYKNQFVPAVSQLAEGINIKKEHVLDIDEVDSLNFNSINRNIKTKLLKPSKYLAKEKIVLPISKYKEEFIKLLEQNRVIIVKGEPGCGKSTRIPQYVLESWARKGMKEGEPCQIAVTQPRRIAAISLADRVSYERDENCGHIVGYQIRLKSNFNPTTGKILYCTTGVLLKYVQSDINLSNFTHIILDEVHERDVNTDLLLNLLKSALDTNSKMKLIVMSATVDVDLFREYLHDPPVMHIPGFVHAVKSYFMDDLKEINLSNSDTLNNNELPNVVHENVVKTIKYIHKTKDEGAILCFLPGWEDIMKVEKLLPASTDMTVLCLHSRLPDSEQRKIFSKTPPGVRKVILSTNIAETSVTIDDVAYVVDTGIHKENRFDSEKGFTCIDNYWISQASMAQRKGRAGRVKPGESFHLYSKSKYESLPQFTDPEILKMSLTKIVLNSKVYSNNMDALKFMNQLPSPPENNATRRAVRELKDLKLLDDSENLTPLGRTLATFQLEPKLAKVLVNSVVYKCVTPVVDIITIFSADTELFSTGLVDKENIKNIKGQGSKYSDHLAMMRLLEGWLELMEDYDEDTAKRYCIDANLVHHKLVTINKLRKIHFDYLHNGLRKSLPIDDNYSDNDELVKAILFSGVGNLLRHRNWDVVKGRYKKTNIFLTNYNQKATITSDSVNFKKITFPSDFLVYFNEVRSNIRRTTVIRETSVIAPIAVLLFSDKESVIREIKNDNENVIMGLKDTKIELSCPKRDAVVIQQCKEALDSIYQYFIFQMTEGGEYSAEINRIWNKVLEEVNSILVKHSIK